MSFWSSLGSVLGSVGNAMLGGIPSAIGSIAGGILGNVQQNSANRANMKLAQYQFDKNLEMWHMQNEYNTPKNQMLRYADAGLNKNLIYSQGTPGIAQSAPQYQAPEISKYTNFGDFGMSTGAQAYSAMHQQELNEELAKSQIDYNNAKKEEMRYNNSRTYVQTLSDYYSMLRSNDLHPEQKMKVQKEIDLLEQKRNTEKSVQDLNVQKGFTEQSRRNEIEAHIRSLDHNNRLTDAKVNEVYQGIRESSQRISESIERVKKIGVDIDLVTEQVANCIIKNDRDHLEFQMRRFEDWFQRTYHTKLGASERQMLVGALSALFTTVDGTRFVTEDGTY